MVRETITLRDAIQYCGDCIRYGLAHIPDPIQHFRGNINNIVHYSDYQKGRRLVRNVRALIRDIDGGSYTTEETYAKLTELSASIKRLEKFNDRTSTKPIDTEPFRDEADRLEQRIEGEYLFRETIN